jgi:hypothetical protein
MGLASSDQINGWNVSHHLQKRKLLIAINCVAATSIFFFGMERLGHSSEEIMTPNAPRIGGLEHWRAYLCIEFHADCSPAGYDQGVMSGVNNAKGTLLARINCEGSLFTPSRLHRHYEDRPHTARRNS